jgi:hypothetical protein
MKNTIKILSLLIAALLLLPACNGAATEPAPEAPPEHQPNLELAQKTFKRLRENEEFVFSEGPSLPHSLSQWNFQKDLYDTEFHKMWVDFFVYDDINDPVFPSYQVSEQIKEGLFINEVYAILGAPHFNVKYSPMAASYNELTKDCYTFYVLDSGEVLVLRYSTFSYGAYSLSELDKRIPDFEKNAMSKFPSDQWRILTSANIVSIESLIKNGSFYWDDAHYETSAEHSYLEIAESESSKIEIGMTYGQVKKALGCCGYLQYKAERDSVVPQKAYWYIPGSSQLYVRLEKQTDEAQTPDGYVVVEISNDSRDYERW